MTSSNFIWQSLPTELPLEADAVHVWRAALDVLPVQIDTLQQVLSVDEIDRANRFYFPRDRHRFIVGRGLLRSLLSRYMQTPPHMIRFDYTAFGKPIIVPAVGQEPLNFNVSHSDGLALYALTRGRAIGVDIERIRQTIEYNQVAAHFFSPTEYACLCALPAEHQATAFFTCWTRKEAYIKAHGAALSMPLDRFAVSLALNEPVRLLHTLDDPAETSRWSLQDLFPDPGYQAALAVEGHGWHLMCWHLSTTG